MNPATFIDLDTIVEAEHLIEELSKLDGEGARLILRDSGADAILVLHGGPEELVTTAPAAAEAFFSLGRTVGSDPTLRVFWLEVGHLQSYWTARRGVDVLRRLAVAYFGLTSAV